MAKKQRKTRVTKKQIEQARKPKKKPKVDKKNTKPGPWTEMNPPLEVKAKICLNQGIIGEHYGTYPTHSPITCEKGWYPILFNLTSKSIKRDVEEHGLDNYIAACEKSLNSDENKKKYGTIVIMKVTVDNSAHELREKRFLSCHAKTNKKSIKGFTAIRKKVYMVL